MALPLWKSGTPLPRPCPSWLPRSWSVASARDLSRGANRSRLRRSRASQTETYWGRPLPGFGDPEARVFVLGLAPAAHGGNRTGRIFTGDRSGDFLVDALHATGFANQPTSTRPGDGLALTDLYVAAAVRCAPPMNRPTNIERDNCAPYLVRELAALHRVRVIVALGAFAWDAAFRTIAFDDPTAIPRPRPRFGHGAEAVVGSYHLIGSFHPSQRNTFTGRLSRRCSKPSCAAPAISQLD